MRFALSCFVVLILVAFSMADEPRKDWSASSQAALAQAGTNRPEIEKALSDSPADQKRGMEFIVANMPDQDLKSLSAEFLLENLKWSYQARKEMPWGAKIPEELFFNNVLAYVNVDEKREPWRKELYEISRPLVKECKTPAEAVHLLNSKLFPLLKVKYSTERKKAQQSPSESMATGKASCTGLSILLSDACRSVCIPTRIVGTPLWADKRGNHTWLEIWDERWHFTGACEPDPNGLDRGWFVGDAAKAKKDVPEHAIYASSFQKTPVTFPLVWAPGRKDVYAENVTERYAPNPVAADGKARLRIRVYQAGKFKREVIAVTLIDKADPKSVQKGQSRGESADTNDILEFSLIPDREYILRIGDPAQNERIVKIPAGKPETIDIELAGKK